MVSGRRLTMHKVPAFLLRIVLTILAMLPLRALYVLGWCCYVPLYYCVRYRRRLVRTNLTRSYPEKSPREIKTIEKQFYRHFCNYVVETIKLLHISDEEMRRRMRFVNMELVERLRTDGKPFFVYLGHYGNWEYITSITQWYQPGLETCHVYHPLSGKAMEEVMRKLRTRFHSFGIPQDDTFRTLLRMKDEGRQALLGLIADQRPAKRHHEVWTIFLRQPTALITGSERIGQRLDVHFLYGEMEVVKRGYYTLTMKEILPDEKEEFSITRQYMRLLEQTIDRAPQYYLWTHDRWKWQPGPDGTLVRNTLV